MLHSSLGNIIQLEARRALGPFEGSASGALTPNNRPNYQSPNPHMLFTRKGSKGAGSHAARALVTRTRSGGQVCNPDHPAPFQECQFSTSRCAKRCSSQSSTSLSTHPTRFGPSCTRLGNRPAFSRRAMCCGEYKTNSLTWRFESILITISP